MNTTISNMTRLSLRVAFSLVTVVTLAGPLFAQGTAQPSKETLIETLQLVVQQLEAKKYTETEKYFYLPKNFEQRMFEQLIKRDVISRRGVEAIDLAGEFGRAIGVLRRSDVEEAAAEFSVPVDQCYAMKMEQNDQRCKVIAHWTGKHFKILDINRVGKMDPDKLKLTVQAPSKPWPTGSEPTKELLIESLKVFLHQIKNRHYDALRPNVYVPDDFVMSRFGDSLERDELSAKGIKILAAQGTFGKADTVYPKLRAEALTKRVNVPVEESYGLLAKIGGEQGEVLAHWIGDRYKLLRADDVGKLPAALKAKSIDPPVNNAGPSIETPSPSTSGPVVAAPAEMKGPMAKSAAKASTTASSLPTYETDQSVVIANYSALVKDVAANPSDISLRARFVHSLLVIGNTPKAWEEAMAMYQLDPQHIEVAFAIDQSIEALKKNGIFQVGVPEKTIESLMGVPVKKVPVEGIVRWEYPNWNVDFNDGRFVKLSRIEPAVLPAAQPATEMKAGKTAPKNEPIAVAVPARFNVELSSYGTNKIAVIRVIREFNEGMRLLKAKQLVEGTPSIVVESVAEERAEAAKEKFIAAGASVEIKEIK